MQLYSRYPLKYLQGKKRQQLSVRWLLCLLSLGRYLFVTDPLVRLLLRHQVYCFISHSDGDGHIFAHIRASVLGHLHFYIGSFVANNREAFSAAESPLFVVADSRGRGVSFGHHLGRPGQKGLFFTVFYPSSGGFLFAYERREKQRGAWFGEPVLPIKHLHSQYCGLSFC